MPRLNVEIEHERLKDRPEHPPTRAQISPQMSPGVFKAYRASLSVEDGFELIFADSRVGSIQRRHVC